MLSLSDAYRYYCYRQVADMRKGINGLAGLVRNELGGDPLSGDIFIFISRRRNQLKLLLWEGDGFSLYQKRLERGTFEFPWLCGQSDSVELSGEQLLLILRGIRLKSVRKRKRFSLKKSA